VTVLWAFAGAALAQPSGTVTIVEHNDLHANLLPHLDLARNATGNGRLLTMRGGLAKSKTLIDQVRASNPNTLAVNVGDTFHGGVEALYSEGNAIVAPVNAMGFDVGVMGNWDWAYGPQVTRYRFGNLTSANYPKPTFTYIGGNVTYTTPPNLAGQPMKPATLTRTMPNGVKVGFIGITSDIVPMMDSRLALGFSFLQGETNYVNYINTNRAALQAQGCQVILVLSELGVHKDRRLADLIAPGVHFFMSAHTHELVQTPMVSASGARVAEPGNDGYLGRLDITVTSGIVTAMQWTILPVTVDVPDDPTVANLITQARAPYLAPNVNIPVPNIGYPVLTQPINTVVGSVHETLDRKQALESSFNNFFTDALREKAGTQVAMTPGFRFDSVLTPSTAESDIEAEGSLGLTLTGQVTLEQVYRFFPIPYTLATGQSTGSHLKGIMEGNLTHVYSTTIFNQGGGWFDGFSGVDTVLNLAGADGTRISQLKNHATGLPFGDSEPITVAGCVRPGDPAGTMCSYTGFTNTASFINPASGQAWTPVDIFIDALHRTTAASGRRRNFVDLNETASWLNATSLWPSDVFVQPLLGVVPIGCAVDCTGDNRVDIEDLYWINQNARDVNGDGVYDVHDIECIEAFIRRNEIRDMTAGRR
jgi:2',3'-cyclic-nucleotide 2'-phosphodiesterase (5'-nucleotidase family)